MTMKKSDNRKRLLIGGSLLAGTATLVGNAVLQDAQATNTPKVDKPDVKDSDIAKTKESGDKGYADGMAKLAKTVGAAAKLPTKDAVKAVADAKVSAEKAISTGAPVANNASDGQDQGTSNIGQTPVATAETPSPQYQAPATEAPIPQYQAPAPQYQAPAPQYQAPTPQYQAPTPAPAPDQTPNYNYNVNGSQGIADQQSNDWAVNNGFADINDADSGIFGYGQR